MNIPNYELCAPYVLMSASTYLIFATINTEHLPVFYEKMKYTLWSKAACGLMRRTQNAIRGLSMLGR